MDTYHPSTIKKCLHCGNEFVGFGHSKYCKGEKCRQNARTIRLGGTPTGKTRPFAAIIINGKKQCKKCGEWLPIDSFREMIERRIIDKKYHYHLCHHCERECQKIKARRRTYEGRLEERKKQAAKKGRIYNARKLRPISDLYSESLVARNARDAFNWWFEKKNQEEKDAWYEASGKPWNNPRLSDSEKWKIRYSLDNEFNAQEKTRASLRKYLYRDGIGNTIRSAVNRGARSKAVENMIGYTVNELIIHLEKQFTKGMTWDKFKNGEIHIDHIIPKSSFDLNDLNNWRICWGMANLRPIWAKDNIKKGKKIVFLL